MTHIRIRPRGSRGTLWYEFRLPDGRRIRESARTTDLQEARRRGERAQERLLAGGERQALTVRAAVEKAYHEWYQHTKGATMHRLNLGMLAEALGPETPLRDVGERRLAELVEQLRAGGNGPATINRKLSTLQKVMRLASQGQWEPGLRVPFMPRQRESEHRLRFITPEEERQIFDAPALQPSAGSTAASARALFAVLLDTGLRLGEALRLTRQDVDTDRRLVTVWQSKGGRPRSVPLTRRAQRVLAEQALAAGAGRLFPLDKKTYERAWNRVRESMGLQDDPQFIPHALRHTTASRMVQAGVSLYEVKEILGHSSITVTERYAHLSPERLRAAVDTLESQECL